MPVQSSLCLMARMVRDRAVSPVELVNSHLAQIAAQNPRINAFVMVLEEEARTAAKAGRKRGAAGRIARAAARGSGHRKG